METCYEYTEDGKLWISSDEKKTINRLMRFKEEFPEDVTVLKYPKENDGCIYGWVDRRKFNLNLNRKNRKELTDEERAQRAEKFRERIGKRKA